LSHCIVVARPRAFLRQEAARLLGQVDEDGARLEHRKRSTRTSWSTIAGIFWFGLIAVKAGENCSSFCRFTGITL